MTTVVLENGQHKIVKTVDSDSYTAFCFFWEGPFRAIYSVQRETDRTVGNFTIWALDKATGIWGCFADAHDLGFDYFAMHEQEFEKSVADPEADIAPEMLEKIDDAILRRFLELVETHINKLYFDKPVTRVSTRLFFTLDESVESSAQE